MTGFVFTKYVLKIFLFERYEKKKQLFKSKRLLTHNHFKSTRKVLLLFSKEGKKDFFTLICGPDG